MLGLDDLDGFLGFLGIHGFLGFLGFLSFLGFLGFLGLLGFLGFLLGTLFLKSSYHHLFKNISYVDNLTKTVFVYLCICICVFGCQTRGNIVFEVLVRFPFQKYITSWVFLALEL